MPTTRTRTKAKTQTARSGSTSAGNSNTKKGTPTIQDLSFQTCGNCHVGVLSVIRYDPDALHEEGQSLAAENQQPSGGAYETQCGFCGQRLSHSLNSDNAGEGA